MTSRGSLALVRYKGNVSPADSERPLKSKIPIRTQQSKYSTHFDNIPLQDLSSLHRPSDIPRQTSPDFSTVTSTITTISSNYSVHEANAVAVRPQPAPTVISLAPHEQTYPTRPLRHTSLGRNYNRATREEDSSYGSGSTSPLTARTASTFHSIPSNRLGSCQGSASASKRPSTRAHSVPEQTKGYRGDRPDDLVRRPSRSITCSSYDTARRPGSPDAVTNSEVSERVPVRREEQHQHRHNIHDYEGSSQASEPLMMPHPTLSRRNRDISFPTTDVRRNKDIPFPNTNPRPARRDWPLPASPPPPPPPSHSSTSPSSPRYHHYPRLPSPSPPQPDPERPSTFTRLLVKVLMFCAPSFETEEPNGRKRKRRRRRRAADGYGSSRWEMDFSSGSVEVLDRVEEGSVRGRGD